MFCTVNSSFGEFPVLWSNLWFKWIYLRFIFFQLIYISTIKKKKCFRLSEVFWNRLISSTRHRSIFFTLEYTKKTLPKIKKIFKNQTFPEITGCVDEPPPVFWRQHERHEMSNRPEITLTAEATQHFHQIASETLLNWIVGCVFKSVRECVRVCVYVKIKGVNLNLGVCGGSLQSVQIHEAPCLLVKIHQSRLCAFKMVDQGCFSTQFGEK